MGPEVLVRNCPRLSLRFCDEVPLKKGPKRRQQRTIVDDCAQIAEKGVFIEKGPFFRGKRASRASQIPHGRTPRPPTPPGPLPQKGVTENPSRGSPKRGGGGAGGWGGVPCGIWEALKAPLPRKKALFDETAMNSQLPFSVREGF